MSLSLSLSLWVRLRLATSRASVASRRLPQSQCLSVRPPYGSQWSTGDVRPRLHTTPQAMSESSVIRMRTIRLWRLQSDGNRSVAEAGSADSNTGQEEDTEPGAKVSRRTTITMQAINAINASDASWSMDVDGWQ